MRDRRSLVLVIAGSALLAGAGGAAAETGGSAYPIAGLHPDQRPAGAPVITEFVKDPAWYQRALTGISEPYPASLRFLEDQGVWYTPFIHPGMTGPYDIRGWHGAER